MNKKGGEEQKKYCWLLEALNMTCDLLDGYTTGCWLRNLKLFAMIFCCYFSHLDRVCLRGGGHEVRGGPVVAQELQTAPDLLLVKRVLAEHVNVAEHALAEHLNAALFPEYFRVRIEDHIPIISNHSDFPLDSILDKVIVIRYRGGGPLNDVVILILLAPLRPRHIKAGGVRLVNVIVLEISFITEAVCSPVTVSVPEDQCDTI